MMEEMMTQFESLGEKEDYNEVCEFPSPGMPWQESFAVLFNQLGCRRSDATIIIKRFNV